jgi:hypothetical protein
MLDIKNAGFVSLALAALFHAVDPFIPVGLVNIA